MENWDEIRKEFEDTDQTLQAIADKFGVKIGTLKSRKSREKWSRGAISKDATKKVATKKKVAKDANKKDASKKKVAIQIEPEPEEDQLIEIDGLTEKQRLFCLHYVKTFNATQSAIKAGYSPTSAHVRGSELVRDHKVGDEIRRIKANMVHDLYIDAKDVLNKYIKIAFTDITDYLTFGRKEIEQINEVTGEIETFEVNHLDFKNSDMIDGTLISEVKQGKDGVSIKLEDKMKALDKLSQYFDLFPDKFKRDIESEKLKIAQAKMSGGDGGQEKDVAQALRGLVDAVNAQTD